MMGKSGRPPPPYVSTPVPAPSMQVPTRMDNERDLIIQVEYRANQVPRDVDEAINRIMREAAVMITAKIALLSDPRVVSVKATTFLDNRYQDLCTHESNPDRA